MAYDASDREVVIFGGTYPNGSDAVYTWGFRGGAWSVLAPVAVPPGEDYSMMTPDPISGGVLLYELADDGSGDYTWTYANGTWTDLSAETGAGAMEWGQLAEDPVHGAVVYVGGYLNGAAGGPLYLPVTLVLHRSITLFLGADPASGSIEAGGTANFTAAVAGGIGGYRYAWNTTLASCASPSGMLLSCPSVANGSYGVSVSVSDAVDPVVNASLEYVVNITHVAIGAISATRLFADVGQAVTFSVATGGGIPPLSLQWSGLPPGCSGSGPKVGPCTVTSVGNFTIVARVADGAGLGANSTPLGFAVYADPSVESPEIRTASPAAVAADVGMWANLSVALAAPGAGGPYQYAWSDLPGGCAGNNSTLAPCRLTTPGVFGVSVKVTDAAGFDARSPITLLTVSPRMDANLSWFPVPPVAGGLTFLNATVEGGSAPFNFTWSIRGAFSGNGPSLAEVFGSPGPVPVTVSIRDAAGQYVNQSISPIVGAAATSPAPLLTGAEQLGLAIGLAAVVVAVAVILLGRRARGAPGEPNPGGAAENDGGASADVGGESGGAPTEEPMDPTGDEGSTPSESSLSEER
jgi:hypothetical protein